MNARLQELIRDNVDCLYQGLDLLSNLPDSHYNESPGQASPHRVGGHLRHSLEFYECYFDGLEGGLVDYDARKRDADVEQNRDAAIVRLLETIDRLNADGETIFDRPLWVRVEGSAGSKPTQSSIARELGFLLSHTIHHFALIAMTLQTLGVKVDPAFGVSPSTLRYRAEAGACAR